MVQTVLDDIYPGTYEADPCDRYELINIGYLRRENGKQIVPNRHESFNLKEKLYALILKKIKENRKATEKWIDKFKKTKSHPRCNLGQIRQGTKENSDNLKG
jgi:hypothetical protein